MEDWGSLRNGPAVITILQVDLEEKIITIRSCYCCRMQRHYRHNGRHYCHITTARPLSHTTTRSCTQHYDDTKTIKNCQLHSSIFRMLDNLMMRWHDYRLLQPLTMTLQRPLPETLPLLFTSRGTYKCSRIFFNTSHHHQPELPRIS